MSWSELFFTKQHDWNFSSSLQLDFVVQYIWFLFHILSKLVLDHVAMICSYLIDFLVAEQLCRRPCLSVRPSVCLSVCPKFVPNCCLRFFNEALQLLLDSGLFINILCLEGKDQATRFDIKFIETSAIKKHNMDELLVGVTKQMLLRKKQSLVHGDKEPGQGHQTKVNQSLIF